MKDCQVRLTLPNLTMSLSGRRLWSTVLKMSLSCLLLCWRPWRWRGPRSQNVPSPLVPVPLDPGPLDPGTLVPGPLVPEWASVVKRKRAINIRMTKGNENLMSLAPLCYWMVAHLKGRERSLGLNLISTGCPRVELICECESFGTKIIYQFQIDIF